MDALRRNRHHGHRRRHRQETRRRTLDDQPLALRGILDIAVKDKRLRTNPAAGIDNQPKKLSQKDRRYLDDATLAKLATTVTNPTHAVLVLTLGYTGLRWGEAIALRVRDVNMLRRRLHVVRNAVEVEGAVIVGAPKSWEKRTVPFPAFLDTALTQLMAGKTTDALVFTDGGDFLRRPKTDEDSGSCGCGLVAEHPLHGLDVRAGGDGEAGGGMAEVVDGEPLDAGCALGGAEPDARHLRRPLRQRPR